MVSPGGREKMGGVRCQFPIGLGQGSGEVPTAHTSTFTSQPQPMLTEPAPETMRLSLPLLLLLLGAWAIPGGLGNRASLTATAPELDDEEKYSVHMPAHLRCDACKAVAYQVSPFPQQFPCPVLLKSEPSIYLRFHHWPLIYLQTPTPRHPARLSLP